MSWSATPATDRVARRSIRLREQFTAERVALREAGDLAGVLGVTIAIENYYPELPIVRGVIYDYSVWPSELADREGSDLRCVAGYEGCNPHHPGV
jgi:hypothetical protein